MWRGRALAQHVLEVLAPQVSQVLISANRHLDAYAEIGRPWQASVCIDTWPDYPGPLAGILAALQQCQTPWLAVAPCDCPGLPADWVHRLSQARNPQTRAVYAHDGERAHYAVCLVHRSAQAPLHASLASGQRRLGHWLQSLDAISVAFDQPQAFANLNTPQDWSQDQTN